MFGHEDAIGNDHVLCFEIMIGCRHLYPALPTPREIANFDGRFSVARYAQHGLTCIGFLIDPFDLLKYRIRLGYLFWGLLLPTARTRYPNSFNRSRITSVHGNSSSLYPFCSINCLRVSFAVIRVYSRELLKLGSV